MQRLLSQIVGPSNVAFSGFDETYSHDATFLTNEPDMVIHPASTEEVAAVTKVLYTHNIPITCRGAGTGLSGGPVALQGGAVLCLDRLTGIDIDAPSMCAVVGAGAINLAIKDAARNFGLMYPPDPASMATCTIGGNIATNAGGASCLKYGVTAEYVMGLTVVLADGRVLNLGGKSRKRSAGYRLSQLFVGSEGTLGIVTQATLRLVPLPDSRTTLLAAFGSVDASANAVAGFFASGILPVACELIDRSSLSYVADLLPETITSDAAAVLLVEFDDDLSKTTLAIEKLNDAGATSIAIGMTEAECEQLWDARRAIGERLMARRSHRLSEDLGVPVAKVPEMIKRIHQIAKEANVEVAVFGHAGDGNIHPSLIFEDRDPQTLSRVAKAASAMFQAAIDLGGTVSAEHGLGAIKREFATAEMGELTVDLMRNIKEVFDPKGLLNPGKIFPSTNLADETFMDALPGWFE
ncbi:MAG: FAD-linked oxidase C-terminal domain-containing protein [Actinomycetota bacterium]